MRILAFSDLHQNVDVTTAIVQASGGADVLVGAGDFSIRGDGASVTIDILRHAKIPVILVSGNHDRCNELQQLCADWEGGHVLHGNSVTVKGVSFFGLGAETPRRESADWSESMSDEMAERLLADCPAGAVLVTHTSPFGYADFQTDGTHEGSPSVLKAIEAKQPLLNLCGHIHNSWGQSGLVGSTRIHNFGPTLNWFEI